MAPGRPAPHQHHTVVNRNRASRGRALAEQQLPAPPNHEQHELDDERPVGEICGRLNVVPVRMVNVTVPHSIRDDHELHPAQQNPYNQMGPLVEQCVPLVTCGDFTSFMAAFNKRCNFEQQGESDDIETAVFNEALALIDEWPDMFDLWDDDPADRERWLAKFDKRKRTDMERAYGEVVGHDSRYVGTKTLSVKKEVLIKRDDPSWAPRIIYAGNDVFNTITGPALMVVMERLVAMVSSGVKIGPVQVKFAYKTNDVELCKFIIDENLPHAVEGDFSRNDREQRSRVALLFDAVLKKLRMPDWLRTLLLDLEHYTVESTKFGFRAELKYQLPTGTTSTTARNSIYNALMFGVVCKRQRRHGRAIILGDDLLASLNQRLDIKAWVEDVARFKMVLKGKEVSMNGEATFLSRRIFSDVADPCMVPLLGKMLVRFNIRSAQNQGISDSAYMAGKALSYAYESRHVPALRNLFLRRYRMENDNTQVQLKDLSWFARTSELSLDQIVKAIENEKVLLDDLEFGAWCCETYDIDYVDTITLFERIVCDASCVMLDEPLLDHFKTDL